MEPRRRIQIHDHSDFNSGGLVAAHTIVRAAGVPDDPTITPGGGSPGLLTVLDEGVPLYTTVSSIDFTGAGVTATNTGPAVTVTIPGGSTLSWFVVTDYGAVGNGTTDDTAAINLAIAALNTATKGVLYFPAGAYKVTSALTTITASGVALGDGMASYDNAAAATRINFTSQTAVLFTVSAKAFRFEGIGFVNTYAGTPSAGTAILADSSYLEQRVDFEACSFQGFYDNVDVKVGAQWSMRGCFNIAPVRYGLRIRNTVNVDAGDWSISDCAFSAQTYNSDAAIRVESSGGGKIVNTKINMALDAKHFTTGIDFAIPTSTFTSVALISACSVENVTGDAVRFITTGTGSYGGIAIAGLQVGLYSNNTGRAVKISAASAAAITGVTIDGSVFITDGTARAAIELTNTDKVTIGDLALVGFNARYTSTGDTNTIDGATPSFATPAIVLGTAAAAGAASTVIRSDATIVAFDATVPVTQAFGDAAATGSAATAAHRDHKHGMPASPSASGSGSDHEHIVNVVFSGDGSATAWELPAAPVDAISISVYVTGSRSIAWVLSGALLTTLTFDSAPASAANNIVVDIVAATA